MKIDFIYENNDNLRLKRNKLRSNEKCDSQKRQRLAEIWKKNSPISTEALQHNIWAVIWTSKYKVLICLKSIVKS